MKKRDVFAEAAKLFAARINTGQKLIERKKMHVKK